MKPYLFPFFSFHSPVLTSTVQVIGLAVIYAGIKVENQLRTILKTLAKDIDEFHPTGRVAIIAKNIFTFIKGNLITKTVGKYFFFYVPKDFVLAYGFALFLHSTCLNKPYMNSEDFFS